MESLFIHTISTQGETSTVYIIILTFKSWLSEGAIGIVKSALSVTEDLRSVYCIGVLPTYALLVRGGFPVIDKSDKLIDFVFEEILPNLRLLGFIFMPLFFLHDDKYKSSLKVVCVAYPFEKLSIITNEL